MVKELADCVAFPVLTKLVIVGHFYWTLNSHFKVMPPGVTLKSDYRTLQFCGATGIDKCSLSAVWAWENTFHLIRHYTNLPGYNQCSAFFSCFVNFPLTRNSSWLDLEQGWAVAFTEKLYMTQTYALNTIHTWHNLCLQRWLVCCLYCFVGDIDEQTETCVWLCAEWYILEYVHISNNIKIINKLVTTVWNIYQICALRWLLAHSLCIPRVHDASVGCRG